MGGLSNFLPYYGDESVKDKILNLLDKLDKKFSIHFFITIFIVESVKSYVAGNYYVATRMLGGAGLSFLLFIIYVEYWGSVEEKVMGDE